MQKRKKILSLLFKVCIGLGSLYIIYYRLKSDFTSENLELIYTAFFSATGIGGFLLCLLLIPLNWGIEAYKWKLITAPVQWVSYKTATKSVYSGVCLGNLAPGRATEFLAKIIYFKIENRPKITVLHFIGGMFQLSITIVCGFAALLFNLHKFEGNTGWMRYATAGAGILLLLIFSVCLIKINSLLNYISAKVNKHGKQEDFNYSFGIKALSKLFGFSFLRYTVFFSQFVLLLFVLDHNLNSSVLPGIALYFLITTTIPMISVLEAAIRAAVALVVFKDSGLSNSTLALSSLLIWLINIIIPSVVGYVFLLRQNFNFKLYKTKA